MSGTFFCWYCRTDQPNAGAKILYWQKGPGIGKQRGKKCAKCVARAKQANQTQEKAA